MSVFSRYVNNITPSIWVTKFVFFRLIMSHKDSLKMNPFWVASSDEEEDDDGVHENENNNNGSAEAVVSRPTYQ